MGSKSRSKVCYDGGQGSSRISKYISKGLGVVDRSPKFLPTMLRSGKIKSPKFAGLRRNTSTSGWRFGLSTEVYGPCKAWRKGDIASWDKDLHAQAHMALSRGKETYSDCDLVVELQDEAFWRLDKENFDDVLHFKFAIFNLRISACQLWLCHGFGLAAITAQDRNLDLDFRERN